MAAQTMNPIQKAAIVPDPQTPSEKPLPDPSPIVRFAGRPLIVRIAGQEIITPADVERGKEIIAKMKLLQAEIERFGHRRSKFYKEALATLEKSHEPEDFKKLEEPVRNLDEENASRMRSAARNEAKAFNVRCVNPFLFSLINRATALTSAVADIIRTREDEIAASFGLTLEEPSSTFKTAVSCHARVTHRASGFAEWTSVSDVKAVFSELGYELPET